MRWRKVESETQRGECCSRNVSGERAGKTSITAGRTSGSAEMDKRRVRSGVAAAVRSECGAAVCECVCVLESACKVQRRGVWQSERSRCREMLPRCAAIPSRPCVCAVCAGWWAVRPFSRSKASLVRVVRYGAVRLMSCSDAGCTLAPLRTLSDCRVCPICSGKHGIRPGLSDCRLLVACTPACERCWLSELRLCGVQQLIAPRPTQSSSRTGSQQAKVTPMAAAS